MKIHIPNHIQITEIKGKRVLLDCRNNFFYGVSQTGAEFLRQVENHGDLDKAIEMMSKSYRMPYETIKKDMESFVHLLMEKGLVETK